MMKRNDILLPESSFDAGHGAPYRALGRFGINPSASARDVLDASYTLPPMDDEPALHEAWHVLRDARRRLVVDFFCYELPAAQPSAAASGSSVLPWAFVELLSREACVALPEETDNAI